MPSSNLTDADRALEARERVAVLETRIRAVRDVLHHYVPYEKDLARLEEMLLPQAEREEAGS